MTVAELIMILQALDPDLKVYVPDVYCSGYEEAEAVNPMRGFDGAHKGVSIDGY